MTVFLVASYGTNTEGDKNPCMLIISLDACDEKKVLTEEQKSNNPINNTVCIIKLQSNRKVITLLTIQYVL